MPIFKLVMGITMRSLCAHLLAFGLIAAFSVAASGADRLTAPPMPKADPSFEAYCQQLGKVLPSIRYRCLFEDNMLDESRPSMSRRIEFATTDFRRVFRIGRVLMGIPASLRIPESGPAEQTLSEPNKPESVQSSDLTIKRSPNGQLESVEYDRYSEGSATQRRVGRMPGGLIFIEWSSLAD